MKKFLKQLKENKKGFTLIEMIVVIAIIGVLAAILVPSMSGYLETAKASKKEANARTVYTAAQAAVTALETTNPVEATAEDAPYKKSTATATNAPATARGDLFEKIEKLIGKSNYDKFDDIKVTVDENGAVTKVVVDDGSEETEYPNPITPTPTSTSTSTADQTKGES